MVDEPAHNEHEQATASPAASDVRWRLLRELIRKGDGDAVNRILAQSGETPGAGEFAYWARLSLPEHPANAHVLADQALETDVTLPAAHLAKAHASIATGDSSSAREHYNLARAIDPNIWDPALDDDSPAAEPPPSLVDTPPATEPATIDEPPLQHEFHPEAVYEIEAEEVVAEPTPVNGIGPEWVEEYPVEAESEHALADGFEDASHTGETIADELEDWLEGVGGYETELEEENLDGSNVDESGDEIAGPALEEFPFKPEWHLTSVLHLAPQAPLVDPGIIPKIHQPALEPSDAKPAALNFAAREAPTTHTHHIPLIPEPEIEEHPTLRDGNPTNEFPGDPHPDEVVLLVADSGTMPKLPEKNDTKQRISATLTTVLFHVALFVLLALIIIAIPDSKPPEIIATTSSQTKTDSVRRKIARSVRGTPSAPSQSSLAVLAASTTSQVVAPTVEFDVPQDTLNLGSSFGSGNAFGGGQGSGGTFGVPAAMKSRCSAEERKKMLAKHGGSRATEYAIVKALTWIAQQQNKDGSWGKKYKSAMTGLALLAFLGHCETPDSTRYGNRVMRGIMYLVEISKKNRIYATAPGHSAAYEHGIATYALGESYAIARLGKRPLPGMREAFIKGTQTIINGQNPDGGWSYGYPKKGASDTSVTGWQYQALKAAKHTKIKIDGLERSIERAQTYLAKVQDRNSGGFPYRPGQPGKRSLTGAGVLGLQMLEAEEKYADNIERGIAFALGDLHEQTWRTANMYTWYYNTQACFQFGGNPWDHWNNMFSRTLVTNQSFDGAWDGAGGSHAGADAHLYSTCLAVLMLEVYYRYLPASG